MRSASGRGLVLAAVVALAPTAAAEPPTWVGGTYGSGGDAVTVYVSSAYRPEEATPQQWADFFARLPHGSELGSVVVRVTTPDGVTALCGEGALGCYSGRELVMPGETSAGEAPEQVARHEYGHHVAASRSNPPWRAQAWGAKRWASAAHVCERVQRGTAFPGDDGAHYRLDPGEAFAESYRVLAERRAGAALASWGLVDGSFYPSEAALRALEQDIVKPWSAPTTTRWSGRFTGGAQRRTFPIATPLDGELTAELRLPPGRLDTLELAGADGRVLARGLWSGARTRRLSFVVCGQRRLTLRVRSAGTAGSFHLTLARP
jgi:hypothetical protein